MTQLRETPTGRYYARMFARGAWHIIGPDGFAVHDSSPYGDDKPVVFHDEDEALECAKRCNAELDDLLPTPDNEKSPPTGGDFYNGIEWLACWLLDHAEGETITEEQLRPWAVQAWAEYLKRHNEKPQP